jgi:hypothetical protein
MCVGEFNLAVTYRNIEDHFTWAFAGVYDLNSNRNRRLLRNELAGMLNWSNLPLCIGGDFNVTLIPSERSGEVCLCPAMVEFSYIIFYQGLIDLLLLAVLLQSPSWSRIDRFLISPTWETQSLGVSHGVSQRRLPRLFSNHFPILLDYDDFLRGGKSFTFESIRLKSKGFVDEVKQWWESYHFQGSAM